MSAHTHDPTRGEGDHEIEDPHVEVECPNGHRFGVAARNLLSFEWGAQ
jgi:hypothetical protein